MNTAEISYDLIMEDDMSFVEGTYRLPGGSWQVVIVSKSDRGVTEPVVEFGTWDSGCTGVFIKFPRAERLSGAAVERLLSTFLCVAEWVVVRGPDSMTLR